MIKQILLKFMKINSFMMAKIEIILIIKINTVSNQKKIALQIIRSVVY